MSAFDGPRSMEVFSIAIMMSCTTRTVSTLRAPRRYSPHSLETILAVSARKISMSATEINQNKRFSDILLPSKYPQNGENCKLINFQRPPLYGQQSVMAHSSGTKQQTQP